MNKLTNLFGIVGLSLASIISGCTPKRNIEIVAKADFDRDGIEEVIGYALTDIALTSDGPFDLVIANGKYVVRKNDSLYNAPYNKIKIVQGRAKYGDDIKIRNLSLDDLNDDNLPDISYDLNFGSRKHKVLYNQGDGTLKREIWLNKKLYKWLKNNNFKGLNYNYKL